VTRLRKVIKAAFAKQARAFPELSGAFRKRSKTFAALEQRSEDAWKPQSKSTPPTGDAFLDAVMAYHDRNNIHPLMEFIDSDRLLSLSSAQRHNLALLVELLYARGQPRKGGKHKIQRWQKPHYVIAKFAGAKIKQWKMENGKKEIPLVERQEIVANEIRKANEWPSRQGKPQFDPTVGSKDFERVERLLREAKSRRL
jgi:hypothetical protein